MPTEHTPIFGWPYPDKEEPPNGPLQIGAAIGAIEDNLKTIRLLIGEDEAPAEPKAGEIVVVNGTNDPRYIAATGDATINANGVITIGESKVVAAKIAALAVETAKIANEAVSTAKIAGLAVTTGKLAALAVTAEKLAAEAVETGKIKNLAVTEAKLADAAVTTRKLKPTEGEAIYLGAEAWLAPAAWSNFAEAFVSCATTSIIHAVGAMHGGGRTGLNSAGQVISDWFVDGVQQGRGVLIGFEQSPGVPGIPRCSNAMLMRVALAPGVHAISLRAHGTNNSEAGFSPTGFTYTVYSA